MKCLTTRNRTDSMQPASTVIGADRSTVLIKHPEPRAEAPLPWSQAPHRAHSRALHASSRNRTTHEHNMILARLLELCQRNLNITACQLKQFRCCVSRMAVCTIRTWAHIVDMSCRLSMNGQSSGRNNEAWGPPRSYWPRAMVIIRLFVTMAIELTLYW